MKMMKKGLALAGTGALALWACTMQEVVRDTEGPDTRTDAAGVGTCDGPYPNYWQDPKFTSTGMWMGQEVSNQPPPGWTGPVFRLSQQYPAQLPAPQPADEGWRSVNPFDPKLSQAERTAAAEAYTWAVMRYLQAGNVDNGANGGDVSKDWTLCNNPVRSWVHIPFQTYDPSSGREFMHGLTREAPVTFTLKPGGQQLKTTVWAVGFYNPRAAYALGTVWKPDGQARLPARDMAFPEGAVIGKLLFTTATPEQIPNLENMPQWQANISAPSYCACTPAPGDGGSSSTCSFQEVSQQCPRSPGTVTLLQFDIAVRDDRSPTGWAYGTFVADGIQKASEPNPWNRISPLGLMWGNDTPPADSLALDYPVDPRKNGFAQEVVFWDVADRWNAHSNGGHLGCNGRLNGPADNARSSCLSCHMTASVPDKTRTVPPIFDLSSTTGQCLPAPGGPTTDAVYFATTQCSQPFQGGSVVPGPQYASGRKEWISTDFSLQVSISMVQWLEWQADQVDEATGPRVMQGLLPAR